MFYIYVLFKRQRVFCVLRIQIIEIIMILNPLVNFRWRFSKFDCSCWPKFSE